MEKEFLNGNSERYAESGLYNKLQELNPECYELFLTELVKVARSSNERELLLYSDILLEFALRKNKPEEVKNIVHTTIDEIFPILNKKNPENVKELVSNEFSTVIENLEKIRKDSDDLTASKCLFGAAILTFPGSKIVEGEA